MQRFLFQLFWLVSVLMSEQEVLQNQPVLKLLLLLYAANNNRHLWININFLATGFAVFYNCSPFVQSDLSGG